MKKSLLLIAFATIVSLGYAQKLKSSEVPQVVRNAFQKQYPTVKEVTWNKENGQYEASFDLKKIDHSVLLDETGKIVETEVEIELSQLPQGVVEYVKKNYKGTELKEAAKITDANGKVTYEAELKGMDVLFDSTGKFIKEVKD